MFDDPETATTDLVFEDAARVVVLVEDRNGARRYCEFTNLIGPVTMHQETQRYRDFSGNVLRTAQTGPVEFAIPSYHGWTFYDTTADFTPAERPAVTTPKEIEP